MQLSCSYSIRMRIHQTIGLSSMIELIEELLLLTTTMTEAQVHQFCLRFRNVSRLSREEMLISLADQIRGTGKSVIADAILADLSHLTGKQGGMALTLQLSLDRFPRKKRFKPDPLYSYPAIRTPWDCAEYKLQPRIVSLDW